MALQQRWGFLSHPTQPKLTTCWFLFCFYLYLSYILFLLQKINYSTIWCLVTFSYVNYYHHLVFSSLLAIFSQVNFFSYVNSNVPLSINSAAMLIAVIEIAGSSHCFFTTSLLFNYCCTTLVLLELKPDFFLCDN